MHVHAVLEAWRLEPKALITWPKEHAGRGHYVLGQTEHLILAVRGQPTFTRAGHTTLLKGPFHVRKGECPLRLLKNRSRGLRLVR